jgi:hypothetical protein
MRVSFDGGRINERGVAVAVFDYALHARAVLGVEPVFLHDARVPPEPAQLERFAKAFPTFGYQSDDERQRLIERERIDVAYVLKSTRSPVPPSKSSLTAVHEVFSFFQPHGDAYAYISSWQAEETTGSRYPAVPHIVDPPPPRENLRARFGVPNDAFVVGRHGASDQFNLPFLAEAIEAALNRRKNLWLMLLNTDPFMEHERVVHVPRVGSRQGVADFVGGCDVGLNARRSGEAFGLAIAEYLIQDKPALVWEGGRDRNHLELVDDPNFRFRTRRDLTRLLVEMEPNTRDGFFCARVGEFRPEPVMRTFANVFLGAQPRPRPGLPPGFRLLRRARARLRRWSDDRWIGAAGT